MSNNNSETKKVIQYLLKLCKSQYVLGRSEQAAFEMGVQTTLEQMENYLNGGDIAVEELNLEHE